MWDYYYVNSTTGEERSVLYSTRSTDTGITWSTPTMVQVFYNQGQIRWEPSLASNGNGTFFVSYTSKSPPALDWDIHYALSKDLGQTWSSIGYVNEFHGSDSDLDLQGRAAFTQFTIVVVWQSRNTEYDIFVRVATDLTPTWTSQKVIGDGATDTGGDYLPIVAGDLYSDRAMVRLKHFSSQQCFSLCHRAT